MPSLWDLFTVFDWITPSYDIVAEAADVVSEVQEKRQKRGKAKESTPSTVPTYYELHGYRRWGYVSSCRSGARACRNKEVCLDCFGCTNHCTCAVQEVARSNASTSGSSVTLKSSQKEWRCPGCDVPQLMEHNTCRNCGFARPFLR